MQGSGNNQTIRHDAASLAAAIASTPSLDDRSPIAFDPAAVDQRQRRGPSNSSTQSVKTSHASLANRLSTDGSYHEYTLRRDGGSALAGASNDPRQDGPGGPNIAPPSSGTAAESTPSEVISKGIKAASVSPSRGAELADSGTSSGTVDGSTTPWTPADGSGGSAAAGEPGWIVAFCEVMAWVFVSIGLSIATAIFLVIIITALITGCGGCGRVALPPVASPQSHFAPPTTVPSVRPAVIGAQASNDAAGKQAGDVYARTAALTPDNLPAEQPPLLAKISTLIDTIAASATKLVDARIAAETNDAAAARLKAEAIQAQALVHQRETELAAANQATAEAKEETKQAKNGEHKAYVYGASLLVGGILFVGVLTLGTGWVVAALVGAFGFAMTPYAIDEIRPWIKWIIAAAVVAVAFLVEAKHKGGLLVALHDRFAPPSSGAGKVAA